MNKKNENKTHPHTENDCYYLCVLMSLMQKLFSIICHRVCHLKWSFRLFHYSKLSFSYKNLRDFLLKSKDSRNYCNTLSNCNIPIAFTHINISRCTQIPILNFILNAAGIRENTTMRYFITSDLKHKQQNNIE